MIEWLALGVSIFVAIVLVAQTRAVHGQMKAAVAQLDTAKSQVEALGVQIVGAREQLDQSREIAKVSTDREKKHATLLFYNQMMSETMRQRRTLATRYGVDPLPEEAVRRLLQSDDFTLDEATRAKARTERVQVKDVLAAYERIAVGVHTGILDLGVITEIGKTNITGAYRRYLHYIHGVQNSGPRAKTNYEHLQWLVRTFDGRDGRDPDRVQELA